ncbi:MAG TPA: hypothetical protein VKB19_03840 [Pedobacter sp.]|nr:hypothetical protein [Pedobacter sp.]
MKSDLEEAIESYEIEKEALEKQIAEYVKEADYKYAHYHQRALRKINRTLDTLKNFQNPLYSSISEQQMYVDYFKRMMAGTKYWSDEYLTRHISERENKILELQGVPVKPSYDSQEVDDAIFGLVNDEISGFKFYFKSAPEVYVGFTKIEDTIHIQLGYDNDGTDNHQYILSDVNKFKALGFMLVNEHWVYNYSLSSFKDALEIKIVLARLVYEVFHYDRRYDEAKIVLG